MASHHCMIYVSQTPKSFCDKEPISPISVRDGPATRDFLGSFGWKNGWLFVGAITSKNTTIFIYKHIYIYMAHRCTEFFFTTVGLKINFNQDITTNSMTFRTWRLHIVEFFLRGSCLWRWVVSSANSVGQVELYLVGGLPTPLKNMSSSVGMMTFPTEWENKKNPNHSPDIVQL